MAGPSDRDALILSHLAYARNLARRLARRSPGLADELESAALVGLTEAADSFDPARGVKFRTHATARIRGAMTDELRAWSPKGFNRDYMLEKHGPAPGIMHLSHCITDGNGHDPDARPTRLADTIPDVDTGPVGWEAEYHDEVAGLARRLMGGPGAEAFRLLHTRADCATMRRAGAAVGLSESRMSQVCDVAGRYLGERFPDPTEVFMYGTKVNRLNGTAFPEPVTLYPDGDGGEGADGGPGGGPGPVPAVTPAPGPSDPEPVEPVDALVRRYAAAHPGLGPGKLSRLIEAETGRKVHSTKIRCVTGSFKPGGWGGGPRGRRRKAPLTSVAALDLAGPSVGVSVAAEPLAALLAAPAAIPAAVSAAIPVPGPSPAPSSLRAELEAMLRVVEALETLDSATSRRVVGWLGARYGEGG